jgi:site-specific recombinase XerD
MVGISVCTSSEAGTDLAVIQALMGHDHVDSSAVYIHLAPIHLRAAYDAARARQRSFESS